MMTDEEEREAKEKLETFIDEFSDILQSMLDDDSFGRFIISDMKLPLEEAWNQLTESPETNIATIKRAISLLEENSLERHGLYGKQLEAKLILFRYYRDKCKMELRKGLLCVSLKKLVDVMDSLFESITDAIGIGGALKEMKDIIYGAMNIP